MLRTRKISFSTPYTLAYLFNKSIIGSIDKQLIIRSGRLEKFKREYLIENAANTDTNRLGLLFSELSEEERNILNKLLNTKTTKNNESKLGVFFPDVAEFKEVFPWAKFTPILTSPKNELSANIIELAEENTEVIKILMTVPHMKENN